MEKLTAASPEAQSADLVAANIEQLKALFPELITEGAGGVAVNVDVLKALVGDASVTDADEKYGLNWHGKRRARQLALTPSTGTLRPCPEDSVDWDTTQNLMIEGDNLEVLKLLQKSYAGKVKLIYIDPPYNTGKDFVYPDNFQDNIKNYLELTGQIEGGQKISSNTEASGRFHTDWLNMMYPRLKLARNLLRDDGVIFCSIDDIEASRLRALFDDIFGEENFVAQFSWRTDGNFDNQAKIKICHEYILLYAKSLESFPHPPVMDPSTPADSKLFRPEIRNTIVKNGPKNPVSKIALPKGFPADFENGCITSRVAPWPSYIGDALVENGRLVNPVVVESGWSSKDLVLEFIKNDCAPIEDSKGQETSFVISRSGAIEVVKRRSDYQSHVISVLNGFGGTQKATAQLNEIGAFFNGYPKPVDLIRYVIQMAHGNDGIFLDFFAGSGPCGHAVMEQNAKDAGSRRYVLAQIPEPLDPSIESQRAATEYCDKIGRPRTIAELTKERLRRAGVKIKADNPSWQGDTGFRVFKLDTSNIRAWTPKPDDLEATLFDHQDHLLEGRSEADVLYELLLKLGLDLCVPIEKRSIEGLGVHAVGGGVLLACLAEKITREQVEPLAQGIIAWRRELAPAGDTTCVFRDSAFADDVAKTNLAAILEQHGIQNVRSL
ncbi:site-specific DNA-methyltransferase [Pseudomonas aeruginosa]|uniref:site-specific DNA-methyltransferase (adenine-specific) n=1 Tax=Mesopusillimonas faecipullorum TaxID=2755040 RepID=A0ABS8CD56_9BURK|nr:site-specific DNA-methyltransferase [Mesopusillimonas faecipullorum]MCB5363769.1 site-specific DNA-methyltransferase [Mesopusillimonas faecipullorum]MCO4018712.1 site-specific DNA-methyltransferase [Pseudomonas aeruginosa]MDI3557826.1 site-specific DNA-methyltransferase [Pseudomonas aeruginosa]